MVPDWAWSHVTKLTPYASGKGAKPWKCNYCGKMYGGPPKCIKAHLAKVSGHDIKACSASNVPLHGVDTKGEEKTGLWLWEQLRPIILDVSVENVVQVIIDNASNCVSMGEHMREEFPFILHNRCVCHVLDLLLEDIGKFDWVSKIVNDCEKIVKFITEKPMLLALFRKFCSRELMKPVKTRFVYIFLMVLSLADREGATTGLIYEAMYRMIEGLELAAQDGKLDVDKIDAIKCVLVEDQHRRRARWFMMHSSMHSAAHALNPSYLAQDLDAESKAKRKFPVSWWESYGYEMHELRKLALRMLSQGVCSSPCEQNWSSWNLIQTKRRNHLLLENLKKLVYVHSNTRVVDHIKSEGMKFLEINFDTIAIEPQWMRIVEMQARLESLGIEDLADEDLPNEDMIVEEDAGDVEGLAEDVKEDE
ncbi:uncharacterized protein LOC112348087 [Selaginella moellendorffii]|uniref:uncharacterized protein LOC112348087 n=1 Tax=Selaginella moellendorffii TaxID=88036 RepID=UPI000D1D0E6F|nr:uncharacterized protein LOC112348087 [Selaginella moellendorffii]|eukprot:XP_024535906.1 uncharacterized protein LOC112348087 [Selaginella moellendorffii]